MYWTALFRNYNLVYSIILIQCNTCGLLYFKRETFKCLRKCSITQLLSWRVKILTKLVSRPYFLFFVLLVFAFSSIGGQWSSKFDLLLLICWHNLRILANCGFPRAVWFYITYSCMILMVSPHTLNNILVWMINYMPS